MELFRFALLGLAIGSLYGVAAQGIVLVYRASGVVNFAQGGFVMLGGYEFYELHQQHGLSSALTIIVIMISGALVGLIVHFLVMKPLKTASPVARVVATLALLQILQAAAVLRYSNVVLNVNAIFPASPLHVAGVLITEDRMIVFFIGLAVTIVLWAVYRFTQFGKATSAVAENELAASSMGLSPNAIAARNWAVGTSLALVTGALVAPIVSLQSTQTAEVVLPALAAALLGGFASFPLSFGAALLIGVGESIMTYEESSRGWWSGWDTSLPFLILIAYLVLRGRGVPLRSHLADRLPKVGSGRVRPVPTALVIAAAVALIVWLPTVWSIAFTVTLCFAIICISVVVVTGYAGQLSLAQYVIGAIGAFIAAKLMSVAHMPFELSFLIGIVSAIIVGAIVGIPALRTRGLNLAVVTLGIGVSIYAVILNNIKLSDVVSGIQIKTPSFFGLSLDPGIYPQRYGIATLILLVLIALAVANLRRGRAGRRLLAVRSNERAALALGVNVYTAKLYSFMLAAGIAAVGVSALAFLNGNVLFSRFDIFASIGFVTSTVVGGLGMVGGGILGSLLPSDGITSRFMSSLSVTLSAWLPLIGGILVIITLIAGADGVFEQNRVLLAKLAKRLRPARAGSPDSARPATPESARPRVEPVERKSLVVEGLTVKFGGVTAVNSMSIEIRPGTVHGLIGPNGAGKTTFIDAITGFVPASAGRVTLDGRPIGRLGAHHRARRGLARSFQSGELFTDLTVRENLAIAGDTASLRYYLSDLVRPGKVRLSAAGTVASHVFELESAYDLQPDMLPFGQRRMVAIARAVASAPSVLLLDEPASGLDTTEAQELGRLIRTLADDWGMAILLVEHNLDMVLTVCDEITVMSAGGELLKASPPDVVRNHPDVVEAYVGVSGAGELSDSH